MKPTITSIHPEQITIRVAYPDDAHELRSLAVLDSSRPVAEPALVAEVGGEIRAALSLRDGTVVADPFSPTEHLRELLRVQAEQLAEPRRRPWRRRRRLTPPAPTPRDAVLASSPQAWLRAS